MMITIYAKGHGEIEMSYSLVLFSFLRESEKKLEKKKTLTAARESSSLKPGNW